MSFFETSSTLIRSVLETCWRFHITIVSLCHRTFRIITTVLWSGTKQYKIKSYLIQRHLDELSSILFLLSEYYWNIINGSYCVIDNFILFFIWHKIEITIPLLLEKKKNEEEQKTTPISSPKGHNDLKENKVINAIDNIQDKLLQSSLKNSFTRKFPSVTCL